MDPQGQRVIKYKKIHLQDLEPREQIPTQKTNPQSLAERLNFFYEWAEQKLYFYKDTGIGYSRILPKSEFSKQQSFVHAFLCAYTQHGNVSILPDDVWLMITMFLSTYIQKHSEKLRHQFVKHQDKMQLVIQEAATSQEEVKKKQKNWDYFLTEIVQELSKNTVEGVVENLLCDFSTTDPTYKVISTAVLMSSLQKYFMYTRSFCICGIENIYMGGCRNDWVKLQKKLQILSQYDVDGVLKQYLRHNRVILQKFVETFDEKPDVEWWNTVMQSPEEKQQYGGHMVEIDGWILHLLGIYKKTDICSLPDYKASVPITLRNQLTKQEKKLMMTTDWISVSKVDKKTYKPDIAVCIYEINKNEELKNAI